MKRNKKIAKLELGTNEVSLDAMHSHTQKDGCVHFPPLPISRLSMMPPPPSSVIPPAHVQCRIFYAGYVIYESVVCEIGLDASLPPPHIP